MLTDLKAIGARRLDHLQCLRFALDTVHRFLHRRIEVLHADTDAVEAQLAEQSDSGIAHFARIDLDGIFSVFNQLEILADRAHHRAQFGIAQKGGRASAKMQLFDPAILAQQRSLHLDLFDQITHILICLAEILGYHLVAGAVKTQCVAERDMDIQRQWAADAADFAFAHPLRVHLCIERLNEAVCRGVGGIARTILVQTANQVQIDFQLGADFFGS